MLSQIPSISSLVNGIIASASDTVVSTFINEPSIKYLLDYYTQQAKTTSEIGNTIAFIDSTSVIVWTLAAGTLSLTGIIGAFATLGYQKQLEDIRTIYDAFFNLKKANDPDIPFDSSEEAVKKRAGDIRRNFVAYQYRLNSFNDSNSVFWEKWWYFLIPTSSLWIVGLILMLLRWTFYSDSSMSPFFIFILWAALLSILILIIYTMNYFIEKMKTSKDCLPKIEDLLNVGINNEIDALQHLLDTAGVYVSSTTIDGIACLRFSIFYSVPFHNYALKPNIKFYNQQGDLRGNLPTSQSPTINHEYDANRRLVEGDNDEFYVQIIDGSTSFYIRLQYKCESTTRLDPALFAYDKFEISRLNDGKYHFIKCGHSWSVPADELRRWMDGRKYIINMDGTVTIDEDGNSKISP